MWNDIFLVVLSIIFFLLFFLCIKSKHRKPLFILIVLLISCYGFFANIYPVENLFYSFPTAERAADYICSGELLGIVEGTDSALLVYTDPPNTIHTVILPRSEGGYHLGSNSTRKEFAENRDTKYFAQLLGCPGREDRYWYISGPLEGSSVTIADSSGSAFVTSLRDIGYSSIEEKELFHFIFFALLNPTNDDTFHVTITDTGETTDLTFEDVSPG